VQAHQQRSVPLRSPANSSGRRFSLILCGFHLAGSGVIASGPSQFGVVEPVPNANLADKKIDDKSISKPKASRSGRIIFCPQFFCRLLLISLKAFGNNELGIRGTNS
jgi:hypothetical protein